MQHSKEGGFRVKLRIQPSGMGKAAGEFIRLNDSFSHTGMGVRLLENAQRLQERHSMPGRSEFHKKEYLGAMMDYYNRLLLFAKRNRASPGTISYLELHTSNLEHEYDSMPEDRRKRARGKRQ